MKKNIGKRLAAIVLILALCMTFLTGCGGQQLASEDLDINLPDGTNISTISSDEADTKEDGASTIGFSIGKEGTYLAELKYNTGGSFAVNFTYKDVKFTLDLDDSSIGLRVSKAEE